MKSALRPSMHPELVCSVLGVGSEKVESLFDAKIQLQLTYSMTLRVPMSPKVVGQEHAK